MLKILRLGHYALKVADIERSGRFYREILGLHEHERGPRGEAYFQRGPDHHCLVLYPADAKDPDDPGFPDGPILHHTAWEVASETELEKARRILDGEGIEILAGPKTHPGPGRHTYLRFQDPFGVPYELFCGMEQAVETAAEKPFQPQRLGHVGLGTKDLDGSVKFATEVLGFRISDWVRGVLCFVRCNEDHHALTFVQSGVHNLHHVGYETGDFEGIKRFADHASANNVFLEWGPGRRPPGETLFAYVRDPDGNIVGTFAELVRIEDEERWQVQVLDPGPRSVDRWGSAPPGEDFLRGPGWSFQAKPRRTGGAEAPLGPAPDPPALIDGSGE